MANKKGLFGVINDGAGAGLGLTKAIPGATLGSAIAVTAACPAFVNSSGVLVFPQLNPDGAIVVSTEGAGTCHEAYAKVTGSTSFQDLGNITGLPLTKLYRSVEICASAMTECCVQVVYVDDAAGTPVESVLLEIFLGPGQYTFAQSYHCLEVDTTGGTGVQEIKLQAKLLEATGSDITGFIAVIEQA